MGFGFSFRVAPGVRIRSTPRGLRTSIGPRAARIHVGAGRPTVSTGWGPFTWWTPISGRRGTTHPPTAGGARQRPVGQLSAVAAQAAQQFQALTELHLTEFPATTRPVVPPLPPVDEKAVRRRHRKTATAGLGLLDRAGRTAALKRAEQEASAEIRAREADSAWMHADRQKAADAWFNQLVANDPDTVLDALARVLADNVAAAVPVGVANGEVTVAVLAPPLTVVPERVPGTNAAGQVRLRRPTVGERTSMYTTAVLGHVLGTVKEVLATAPGLRAVRVVVVRPSEPDAYGQTRLQCLLVGRWTRAALHGVQWHTVDAPSLAQGTASELQANLRHGTELAALDLSDKPDIRRVLQAIDVV